MELSQSERYVTPVDASRILKIKATTLANWRYFNKGPRFIKIGPAPSARIFYDTEDLHKWMQARKIKIDS